MKEVRNVTVPTVPVWGATAVANPGNILEYRVTVDATAGLASQVVVVDPIPAYTTLVNWLAATGYGATGVGQPDGTGVAANVFAQISDGTNTVTVTIDATDSETQPGNPTETGFGRAAGTVAGSNLTFYVGDQSAFGTGGRVNTATNYTIVYRVKVD
jgi:uncharacterized repeat protein (TIGR01451 family)